MARKRRPASAITVSRWFSSARRSRSIRLSRNSTSARDTSPISSPRRGSRSGASRSPPVSAWTAFTTEVSGRTTAKRVMTKPISATARAMTAPLISARVTHVATGASTSSRSAFAAITQRVSRKSSGRAATRTSVAVPSSCFSSLTDSPDVPVKGGLDGVDVDPPLEERRAAVEPRRTAEEQVIPDDQRLAGKTEAGRHLHDPVDTVDRHAESEHADRQPALAENRHRDKTGRLTASRLIGREVDEDFLAALRVGDGPAKRRVESAVLDLEKLAGEIVLLLHRVDDVAVEIDEEHVAVAVAIGEVAEAGMEAGMGFAVARAVAGVVEPAPRLDRIRVVGDVEPMKLLRSIVAEVGPRVGKAGDRLDDERVGRFLTEIALDRGQVVGDSNGARLQKSKELVLGGAAELAARPAYSRRSPPPGRQSPRRR